MLLYDLTPRSEGMFIQSGDFVNEAGMNNNSTMTFYGQDNGKYFLLVLKNQLDHMLILLIVLQLFWREWLF